MFLIELYDADPSLPSKVHHSIFVSSVSDELMYHTGRVYVSSKRRNIFNLCYVTDSKCFALLSNAFKLQPSYFFKLCFLAVYCKTLSYLMSNAEKFYFFCLNCWWKSRFLKILLIKSFHFAFCNVWDELFWLLILMIFWNKCSIDFSTNKNDSHIMIKCFATNGLDPCFWTI